MGGTQHQTHFDMLPHLAASCKSVCPQAYNESQQAKYFSPKNGRELGKFGDSYVKKVRERDSLLMLGFSQALTPISPPQPLFFPPSLNPNLDQPELYGNQQPAVSQWPTGIIQQPAAGGPRQTSGAPLPQAAVLESTSVAPGTSRNASAAPQPQFAPIFQPPAAAGAAASTKRVRDETVGKASNQGTGNGGKGVSKRCRACSRIEGKDVLLTNLHQRACIWCPYCAAKLPDNVKPTQKKREHGVLHVCPYAPKSKAKKL